MIRNGNPMTFITLNHDPTHESQPFRTLALIIG